VSSKGRPLETRELPLGVFHENRDRMLHAAMGDDAWLVAASLSAAFDRVHLALSPGKQQQLAEKALRKFHRMVLHLLQCAAGRSEPCIEPLPQDDRFRHPAWQRLPYAAWYQAFLLLQQWYYNATTEVRGVTPHHEQVVTFVARQLLDVWSPSNFPLSNNHAEMICTGGQNFGRAPPTCGALEGLWAAASGGHREYCIGENVVDPGLQKPAIT
jgi:polyhydroxyalkanoate synthase